MKVQVKEVRSGSYYNLLKGIRSKHRIPFHCFRQWKILYFCTLLTALSSTVATLVRDIIVSWLWLTFPFSNLFLFVFENVSGLSPLSPWLPNMFKKTLESVPAPVFLAVCTCTAYTSTTKITISSQSNTVSCWWQNNLIQFKYIPCWGWIPSPKAGSSLMILRSSSFSESQRPHLNENFAPVLLFSTWI